MAVLLAGVRGPTLRIFSDGRVWLRTSLAGSFNKTLPSGWTIERLESRIWFVVEGWRQASFKVDNLAPEALERLVEYRPNNEAEGRGDRVSIGPNGRSRAALGGWLTLAPRELTTREIGSSLQAAILGTAVPGVLLLVALLSAWSTTNTEYDWVLWPVSAGALLAAISCLRLGSGPAIRVFPDGRLRFRRGLIFPRRQVLQPGWRVEESEGLLCFSEGATRRASIPVSALNLKGLDVGRLVEVLNSEPGAGAQEQTR